MKDLQLPYHTLPGVRAGLNRRRDEPAEPQRDAALDRRALRSLTTGKRKRTRASIPAQGGKHC